MATRSVFISYSHDPKFNEKTHRLADKLLNEGIPVVIDKYDLKLGNDIDRYMSDISDRDKYNFILVICTSSYKEKADQGIGNVGKEAIYIGDLVNNNPFQEAVVPIIFEKKENCAQLLPAFFPPNSYWVDLSEEEHFEGDNFKKLLEHLRGVRPFKPLKTQIEINSSYLETELSGLHDQQKAIIFQELIRPIVQECISTIDSMLRVGFWFDLSLEKKALETTLKKLSAYDEKVPDVELVISAYMTMWEYYRIREDHIQGLQVIEQAILLSDKDHQSPNYSLRRLKLLYMKAYSLHMRSKMDEALPLFNQLYMEEAQDILQSENPLIIFNSVLYAAHIIKSKSRIGEANALYRDLVLSIEQVFKNLCKNDFQKDFPIELFIELRNIYYNALFHIENRTAAEEEKFIEYDAIMDEPLLRYKTFCKGLIPPPFMFPIVMIPDNRF